MENSESPSASVSPSGSGEDQKECLVCGHVSHGFHFGILACRACAAFFRRTVAEKKVYKCRHNCKCPIKKEMRNMCRCCRFRRCEELGMNKDDVQLNRDSIGKRATTIQCCTPKQSCSSKTIVKPTPVPFEETLPQVLPPVTTAQISVPATSIIYPPVSTNQFCQPITLIPCPPPQGPSVLQKMQEGYSNYNSSQKSLFTVMYPDNIFATDVYKKATHTEFVKMERGCLSLMFSMLNDWYHPFSQLPHQIKVDVLRSFALKFSLLDSSYRTSQVYPDPEGDRWIMHYGQYLDKNDLLYFFKDDKDPAESAKLFKETFSLMIATKKKMTKLKVDETEIAGIIGIMLWNEVSYLIPEENQVAESVRDRIYSEFHNHLILKHGVAGTGARLGALLFLLHEINVIAKEISEHVMIGKLFNPHMIEVWDDL